MKPALLWHHLPQFGDGYLPSIAYVSVFARCLTSVWQRIRGLGLEGIDSQSIVIRKAPWTREFTQGELLLPGIIVSPETSETQPLQSGTNLRDDVSYAILITMLIADHEPLNDQLRLPLEWREEISRMLRQRPLVEIEEIIRCTVEPRVVIGAEAFQRGLLQSSLMVRFVSRERRHAS